MDNEHSLVYIVLPSNFQEIIRLRITGITFDNKSDRYTHMHSHTTVG